MSGLRQSLPMLFILLIVQVLDVITTDLVPNLESNPVILYLFRHLGEMWWMPKLVIFLLISAGAVMADRLPRRTLMVITTGYTIVVLINVANVVATYLV